MILHSSYFIPNFGKAQLSHRQTLALSEPKVMFHRLKHDLSHDETLPFAHQNLSSRKFRFCKPFDNR